MRILLVHPGASWSTHDVWHGISQSLNRLGQEVIEFRTDGRYEAAKKYLKLVWEQTEHQEERKPPTELDAIYYSGIGLVERYLRFLPDWVLVVAGTFLHPDTFALLRRAGARIACVLTESPFQYDQEKLIAQRVQVVFTNERTANSQFEPFCDNVFYWQHAYDHTRHAPSNRGHGEVAAHDVVFVGTGFEERIAALREIDWTGIDFGLYGSWSLLGSRNRLRKYLKGEIIDNALTAALYREAKIGLNIHRSSMGWGREVKHYVGAESMNPRCYELAACGCFFISDYRKEIEEVFGDWVPTYTNPKEAEELIRYYLEHEEERNEIAEKLPKLVEGETFDARMEQMVLLLEDLM